MESKPERASGKPATSTSWRLIESQAHEGARNMATDMALVESVRAGGPPVLRFYRWWPACISLGRHQPARDHYDAKLADRWGIEFVRRPSGGRAVFHQHEVTYSVVVGDRALGGPRKTYRLIHKGILAGLRLMGAEVDIVEAKQPAIRPSTVPCFRDIEIGSIVANRLKLVGSAMLREGGVILQHGSILLTGDQTPTLALLKVQREQDVVEPAAALTDLLPGLPTWHELVDAIASGVERVMGVHLERSVLSDEETARVVYYSRKFSDPNWTWRY